MIEGQGGYFVIPGEVEDKNQCLQWRPGQSRWQPFHFNIMMENTNASLNQLSTLSVNPQHLPIASILKLCTPDNTL